MKRLLIAAGLAFLLAGCQTQPGTVSDVHTGVTTKHSGMHSVYNGLFDGLWVSAGQGTKNGVTKYAVATRYTSTGLGWAFFREAWSFGQNLNYKMTREQLAGCSGGSCSMIEEGGFELTKAQFEAAAKDGLEFKLAGKNRELIVKVPAKVFRQGLAGAKVE